MTGVRSCTRLPRIPAMGFALLFFAVMASCGNSEDKPVAGDAADELPGTARKLDVLWVMDHSPSMCDKQRALAAALGDFSAALDKVPGIDVQMAAITLQQAPDTGAGRMVGRFVHDAAKVFPPNCFARLTAPCSDADSCTVPPVTPPPSPGDCNLCSAELTPAQRKTLVAGKWKCKGPKHKNFNCSINTVCEASCTKGASGDAFCRTLLQSDLPAAQQSAICMVPGGGDVGGCMVPPDTGHCPDLAHLPAVVEHTDVDNLKCLVSMRMGQSQETSFEGAFRAAFKALDPNGPNCRYQACVDSLRSCCTSDEPWCKETNAKVIAQNKTRCEKDKAELCEYLTPFGHCKRQIPACCQGPHDEACTTATDAAACEAELASKCAGLADSSEVVAEACQHSRLLRPDARLLLIFASDEDDCSMHLDLHPHNKAQITKEIWGRCQLHNDSLISNHWMMEAHCEFKQGQAALSGKGFHCPNDCFPGSKAEGPDGTARCADGCLAGSAAQLACQAKAEAQMTALYEDKKQAYAFKSSKEHLAGWQFAPVSEFVNRFKGLKGDAAQVHVAALAGDAVGCTGKQRDRQRIKFYKSIKLAGAKPSRHYVCAGPSGEAEFGSRYVQLVEGFGERGVMANLCAQSGYGPAFEAIAEMATAGWVP